MNKKAKEDWSKFILFVVGSFILWFVGKYLDSLGGKFNSWGEVAIVIVILYIAYKIFEKD